MTGLAEDMEVVLAPLRQLAGRLSVAERFLVEKVCDEVVGICRDEERASAVTVELMHELEERLEDK